MTISSQIMTHKEIAISILAAVTLHVSLGFLFENYRYGMAVPIAWPLLRLTGLFGGLSQVEDMAQARAIVVLFLGSPVAIVVGGMAGRLWRKTLGGDEN
jgi:hypothetical protein